MRSDPAAHPLVVLEPAAFRVRLTEEAPLYACDGGMARPDLCMEDYRALAAATDPASVADREACVARTQARWVGLRQELDAGGGGRVGRADDAWLREQVGRRLGLSGLRVDGPVHVLAGPVEDRGDHHQVELVLEDPVLGPFPGRLLLPALPVEAPALLMLPGHLSPGGRQLDDMADTRHGRALAAEGFAVLIIGFRAFDAGLSEYQAGLELACAGSSLAAMRLREAGVALELLRGLAAGPLVGERVGVLGHSGGAIWAVLVGAVEPVDAVVFDATSRQFLGVERSTDGASVQVLDEAVPALVELFDCIYTLGVPVPLEGLVCARPPALTPHLFVPYGYQDQDMASVRRFLAQSLRGEADGDRVLLRTP